MCATIVQLCYANYVSISKESQFSTEIFHSWLPFADSLGGCDTLVCVYWLFRRQHISSHYRVPPAVNLSPHVNFDHLTQIICEENGGDLAPCIAKRNRNSSSNFLLVSKRILSQ